MQLVFEQIGHLAGILLTADTAFTAVAGDILSAAGKTVDGKTAGVGTALTLCHAGLIFQVQELLIGEHLGLIACLEAFSGDQCSAESTHDACDIRAYRLTVCNLFEAAQHGIVVEGTALYHDIFTQFGGVGYLDHLEQGIFDDGVSQTGRNIRNGSTFLLGLLYLGIHKNGTPGTQIDGVGRKQSSLCEILYAVVQGFGKGLDKGTAAGGARLVQLYTVNGLVLDLDTLHVLTADIQDAVHIGVKESCGIVMGHRLHLAVIQEKCRFHQCLTVAGRAGADDMYIGRELFVDLL